MTDLPRLGNMACRSLVENMTRNDVYTWSMYQYFDGRYATIEIWMEPDLEHRKLAGDALLALAERLKESERNARNDKREGREVQD